MRDTLYKTARFLGDIRALRTGRLPQRIVRKAIYKHTSRLARWVCKRIRL